MAHIPHSTPSSYEANLRRGRRVLLILIGVLIATITLAALIAHVRVSATVAPSSDILQPENMPMQTAASPDIGSSIGETHLLTSWTGVARANYRIDARVLGARRYYFDLYSRFSPVDFALAWGHMANPDVDAWIQWRQRNRWYYYQIPTGSPYSLDEIRDQSANVHIIPASATLERALLDVEAGDTIRLEGLLVDVNVTLLGWEFETPTSLSRTDSGAGACEVFYVERLVRNGLEYR